jgi:phosphatidylserine/phosphatidylglycerophosphate/cardiolipin synthase-like enzyme
LLPRDTFCAMAKALKKAKESIFITDWFLIPEIYLIRENESKVPELKDEDRLDNILLKKAKVANHF